MGDCQTAAGACRSLGFPPQDLCQKLFFTGEDLFRAQQTDRLLKSIILSAA